MKYETCLLLVLRISNILLGLLRFCPASFVSGSCPGLTFFLFGCFQVVALKKIIRELEQKVQDQEEELDDQAGQIQMLDQVL